MPKNKSSSVTMHRAWNIVRQALLWAGKGGLLKSSRRLILIVEYIRLLPKYLKSLGNSTHHDSAANAIHYGGERELSFDDTPIIRIKMHRRSSMRFRLPCLNPEVDFDGVFDGEKKYYYYYYYNDELQSRKSFLKGRDDDRDDEYECHDEVYEDEGIDVKAEEFIAKFYEQMKLQRQISCISAVQ